MTQGGRSGQGEYMTDRIHPRGKPAGAWMEENRI